MTPVESAIKTHDPENGVYGDCARACIASLLDLPRDEVPHFYAEARDRLEVANALKDAFLAEHGLWELSLPFNFDGEHVEPDEAVERMALRFDSEHHWMFSGASRIGRGNGFVHTVVALGGRIVHDPTYGDPHGIIGPDDDGHYWAHLLLAAL